jgi:CBS domain-containing protein
MEERREEATLRLEDAMRPHRGSVLKATDLVAGALLAAEASHEPPLLVVDGVGGWYSIPKDELLRAGDEGRKSETIAAVLSLQQLPHAHPDQPLDHALRVLGDAPLLAVVSRADLAKLEGVVSLADILNTYRRAGDLEGG